MQHHESRHGEAVALEMKKWKMELDPQCTGKHWKKHPDLPEREETLIRLVSYADCDDV